MAQGENHRIIGYLSKLPTKRISLANIDREISIQIADLRSNGYNPIMLWGHDFIDYLSNSEKYEPHWKTTKPKPEGIINFHGYYNDVTVILHPTNPKTILICDFSKIGTLTQYKVDEKTSDFPLQIFIKEISIERAKEYLNKYPQLLKHPESGKEMSFEDALRIVQQDIELAIWQRNFLENLDFNAGVIIEPKQTKEIKRKTRRSVTDKKVSSRN